MTDLYLITGFLGAGKSTFLKQFVRLFKGKKIQLIINEMGAENIDGVLLKPLGIELMEITGGSVFCSCRIDQFEKALRTFVEEDTHVVITEASGLADPTGIRDFLHGTKMFPNICYRGSICLIDAVRFPKVYEKSRTCVRQLSAADIAVINKTDKASAEELEKTRSLLKAQRPDLYVCETSFGIIKEPLSEVLSKRTENDAGSTMLLTEDLTIRKLTVSVRDGISVKDLTRFLKLFVEMTFRVKGFARTDQGICLVSCVGSLITIEPWDGEAPPERIGRLVILSGAGMPVKKAVREAVGWYKEDFAII